MVLVLMHQNIQTDCLKMVRLDLAGHNIFYHLIESYMPRWVIYDEIGPRAMMDLPTASHLFIKHYSMTITTQKWEAAHTIPLHF